MKDAKKRKGEQENVETPVSATDEACEAVVEETAQEQNPEAEITITRAKLEELNAFVKAAEAKRDEYLAFAQRAQADFDNYRKRNAQLRTEVTDDTVRDTLKEILPSLDNLERALEAAKAEGEGTPLYMGVDMTKRNLEEALVKLGMERIVADPGTPFDPETHNAVMTVEADEDHPAGTVIDCFQTGFIVRSKVVRYAMVRVAN